MFPAFSRHFQEMVGQNPAITEGFLEETRSNALDSIADHPEWQWKPEDENAALMEVGGALALLSEALFQSLAASSFDLDPDDREDILVELQVRLEQFIGSIPWALPSTLATLRNYMESLVGDDMDSIFSNESQPAHHFREGATLEGFREQVESFFGPLKEAIDGHEIGAGNSIDAAPADLSPLDELLGAMGFEIVDADFDEDGDEDSYRSGLDADGNPPEGAIVATMADGRRIAFSRIVA